MQVLEILLELVTTTASAGHIRMRSKKLGGRADMFRKLNRRCENTFPHPAHRWKWQGFFNRIRCVGRKEYADPWERANPSLGTIVNPNEIRKGYFVSQHKHSYKLKNKVLVTPEGIPVSPWNIYWQCRDPDCWHIYFTNRQGLREELLRKPVEQTWPE